MGYFKLPKERQQYSLSGDDHVSLRKVHSFNIISWYTALKFLYLYKVGVWVVLSQLIKGTVRHFFRLQGTMKKLLKLTETLSIL